MTISHHILYHFSNPSMALRCNPSHSSKSAPIAPSKFKSAWFPDVKDPNSRVHRQINTLNSQAYASEIFAKADDLLMFVAFAKKGKKCCHHEVLPEPAQSGNPTCLSKEEGILAANICKQQFNGSEPSWEAIVESVNSLQWQIEAFHSDDKHWSSCLRQYARFVLRSILLSHFSISLLYRYSLLYSSGSSITILKVSHTCQKATFGLKAIQAIPDGMYIMETCSSMSLNIASNPGPSIIEAAPSQLGLPGPRLILGPFCLVNHDCKPNAQVSFLLRSSPWSILLVLCLCSLSF